MIEVISELKWKDEVLVKIPLLSNLDNECLLERIGEFYTFNSEYLRKLLLKSNQINMRQGNIHLIYHKDFKNLILKGLDRSGIELLVKYIENKENWIGTTVSITSETAVNNYAYFSIPKSILHSLDLRKDYTVFTFTINRGMCCSHDKVVSFGLVENFKKIEIINKEDVLTVLDRGYKVGRTDWDTFWLQKVGTEVKVMNKDGYSIDSDKFACTSIFDEISEAYQYYAFIDDKECVCCYDDPTYNITRTIELLVMGTPMQRKTWSPNNYIKRVSENDSAQIINFYDEIDSSIYTFTIDDIYATDWVIYKKGDK